MQVGRYGITESVEGVDYCVEDGDGVASAAWLVRMRIGIGGSLAAPPLPHHRTYGSVYGGSTG